MSSNSSSSSSSNYVYSKSDSGISNDWKYEDTSRHSNSIISMFDSLDNGRSNNVSDSSDNTFQDPCNSYPCLNNGTCERNTQSNGFTCQCKPRYSGYLCAGK